MKFISSILFAIFLLYAASCTPRADLLSEGPDWGNRDTNGRYLPAGQLYAADQSFLDERYTPEPGPKFGQLYEVQGWTTIKPPYSIVVWRHAPDWVWHHEFCHYLDRPEFIKQPLFALASLGPNVPKHLADFAHRVEDYFNTHGYSPHAQWRLLQDENKGIDVIQHKEIKESL